MSNIADEAIKEIRSLPDFMPGYKAYFQNDCIIVGNGKDGKYDLAFACGPLSSREDAEVAVIHARETLPKLRELTDAGTILEISDWP